MCQPRCRERYDALKSAIPIACPIARHHSMCAWYHAHKHCNEVLPHM